MRVIFLGTPDFAEPVLRAVAASKHEVVGVITQPDRTSGRGKKTVFSPVKTAATELDLPVYQFEKISRDGVETIKALNADIMVTAAYGQILSREILGLCAHGVINAHASLLPKYRGSSPVQWSLINGEEVIGVTVMQTEYEVDSGDIILTKKLPLSGDENCGECLDMLAKLAGEGIAEALDMIEAGTAVFTKQNPNDATFCKKLTKEDGQIDFSLSSKQIKNNIRAFTPWPSAYCGSPIGRLKIIKAEAIDGEFDGEVGEVVSSDKNGITVKCGAGALLPQIVQAEGARAMSIAEFLRGRPIKEGSKLY